MAKAEFKSLESAGIFRCSNHRGPLLLHIVPIKRWILVTLWRLLLSEFGDNPGQAPFAKHARPFQ
jgi:hypothetical protein